jgi:hypothetical protein
MTTLMTKQVYVTPPSPPTPTPPLAIPIQFVKPLSYEFRVAEIVNDEGKIESVKLQMQVWEHDEYGSGNVKQYWSDVPRYKFDRNGAMLPP